MLSMKTLRVAIVTFGSALLLGSGIAAAQNTENTGTIHLDGSAALGNAPSPVRLAAESISTAATAQTTRGTTVLGYNVDVGNVEIRVSARTAVPSGYFVRVKLTGAVFRGELGAVRLTESDGSTDALGGGSFTPVQGGAMHDQVVYSVPDDGIPLGSQFQLDIDENLAVSSASPGSVSAAIIAYRDQFDAIDGQGGLSGQYFGGSNTIVEKVSGIAAAVRPGRTATANAAVGFRWFVNPNADEDGHPNTAQGVLGSFSVGERTATDTDTQTVLASGDNAGTIVDAGDLIMPVSGVLLRVEGNLGIGAFSLARDERDTAAIAAGMPATTNCLDPEDGDEDTPLRGNTRGTMDVPNVATVSTSTSTTTAAGGTRVPVFGDMAEDATGLFTLCVTVDTTGPMSNETPLPETEYMGTILLPSSNTAIPPRELATGIVGKIERNGASAAIAYLTTSDKHNQRLIIVNRGTSPILLTDVTFQTEDGTEADLTDGAKAAAALPEEDREIAGGDSMTVKVTDMVSITGNSRRAAAVLSFNGVPEDISVATTQVNLSDSSTDTVMWTVD